MGYAHPKLVIENLAKMGIRWPIFHRPPRMPLGYDDPYSLRMNFSPELRPFRVVSIFRSEEALIGRGHPKAILWGRSNEFPRYYRREVYITD